MSTNSGQAGQRELSRYLMLERRDIVLFGVARYLDKRLSQSEPVFKPRPTLHEVSANVQMNLFVIL